jgi:hypothetical protein
VAILTAIITHLEAPAVRRQLGYLRALAPTSRFVVCHGGSRAAFEELADEDALFIDDPSLRGPAKQQSYNAVLRAVYAGHVATDPDVELVHVIEYDHLVLASDFEQRLEELTASSTAGLFAKCASRRNDTNWPHYTHSKGDKRLNNFLTEISCRDDPSARWGCLGTGMVFRREALAAVAAVVDPPPAYLELLIPTLVYHLGFDVVDIDAVSDLYRAIRWKPVFSVEEAVAEKHAGRAFVHPFKAVDKFERVKTG